MIGGWGGLIVLTDRRQCERAGRRLPEVVSEAAGAGAGRFVFREKDLDRQARRDLAAECLMATSAQGASLIVASDAALARDLGVRCVHLAHDDRAPDERGVQFGRSCHDSAEAGAAALEGAAYVTASPVFASPSKPGYGPELGEDGLRALVAAAGGVPVYALGGVTPERCSDCVRWGAAGVAVMSHVMGAADPAVAVASLLAVLRFSG